ncbi:hypothetical protein [Lactococcus allomyrinae]|uniref:hypothetical protein n=1 Tax=Lactococcus allomyrinae TaxID=2419773 RepID=UPI0013C46E1C|nr:hypothetical protein [Lactococcus allomyrinae]
MAKADRKRAMKKFTRSLCSHYWGGFRANGERKPAGRKDGKAKAGCGALAPQLCEYPVL